MTDEKSNQNIVNFAFVLAGFMTYYVAYVLFEVGAGAFGAVARLRAIEAVKHGIPVGLGLLVFLLLVLNPKAQVWADECVAEVRKVVWPSRKETTAMTIVCCVMCVIAGIGFGLFDLFASQVIKFFVNH